MRRTESIAALPGAVEKTTKWFKEGCHIILITARPESFRRITEKQLMNAGIMYHRLIMDLEDGPRILINDYIDEFKAYAFNVLRNKDGIAQIP
jgi:hypothetical protein